MNRLEILVEESPGTGLDHKPATAVSFVLAIDGTACPEFDDLAIDPCDMVASTTGSGEYFIATCGCGVPECAGVTNGVEVVIEGDLIRWIVPRPYAAVRGVPAGGGRAEYVFAATDYAEQVARMVAAIDEMARRETADERFDIYAHPGTSAASLAKCIASGGRIHP